MCLISTIIFPLWQAGNKLEIKGLESWNRGGPVESWK